MGNAVISQLKATANGGTSTFTTSALASKPAVGDKIIIGMADTLATTGTTVTPPSGWTAVSGVNHVKFGTRNAEVYTYTYTQTDSDANVLSWTFVQSANSAVTYAVLVVNGGLDISNMIVGAFSAAAASTTTQTTPGITTSLPAGTLVVSLQFEATAATETDAQVTLTTSGWTRNSWAGGQTNTVLTASKTMSAAGTPGDLVSQWLNATANRGSVMLAFPPTVPQAAVAITSPGNNSTVTSTPTFTGTAAKGASVRVMAPNDADLAPAVTASTTDGTWSLTPQKALAQTATLYTAKATDTDGVVTSASVTVTYTPPVTPKVQINSPTAGQVVSDPKFPVTGVGNPNKDIYLENANGGADYSATTFRTGSDGAFTLIPDTAMADGETRNYRAAQNNGDGTFTNADVQVKYVKPVVADTNPLVQYVTGEGVFDDYRAHYYDGTNVIDLESVQPIWPGRKVPNLFTEGHIPVVAHRCGSVNFQDHTLIGATRSAMLAVDALEVSVARTSDGVFIGLHDASLDRTSNNTGGGSGTNLVVSTMTWAQVQTYQQNYPVGNDPTFGPGPKPYYKLTDFLDVYAKSHTFFIDPKVIAAAYRPELYALLNTYPDAKNTFVLKYFHTGTGIADEAKAQGFKCWGYAYQSDLDGTGGTQVAATQAKWDYLGMEYGATDAAWATITSYGKPVFVHICPTGAAALQGIRRGAAGVMASGVTQVMAAVATAAPQLNKTVTDHGKAFIWTTVQEFTAATGSQTLRQAYPGMGYYNGFHDTSGQGSYDPDSVFSIGSDGILDANLRVAVPSAAAQSDGAPSTAVPLVGCIMPDNYAAHKGGIIEMRFKTSQTVAGFKFVGMWWPNSDDWNEGEIDWPEADLTKTARPATARPGSYTPGGGMVFSPSTEQFAKRDTSDWHVARSVWIAPGTPGVTPGLYFYLDGTLVWSTTDIGDIPTANMRATLQFECFLNQGTVPSNAAGHVYVDYVAVAS